MINAYILASGSKGNATLIFNESTNLLIDFGISENELNSKLNNIGKNIANLDYFISMPIHAKQLTHFESSII